MPYTLLSSLHKAMGGAVTDAGELAWTAGQIPEVMKVIQDNGWVILGGDVLDRRQEYTYDNWYYQPDHRICLAQNVKASMDRCVGYVSEYIQNNGDGYLFVLVISNTFVDGCSDQ